jgi:signal transduction histidine kinase
MRVERNPRGIVLLTLALVAVVFTIDLWSPERFAVPVVYAGVVLVSFVAPWPAYPVVLATISTFLTGAALLGPDPAAASGVEIANDALAVLLIWVVLGLGLLRRRAKTTVDVLRRINERLTSTLNPDELLAGLVREASTLFDAETGVAALRTRGGIVCRRQPGTRDEPPVHFDTSEEGGLAGWLATNRQPYLQNHAAGDPLLRDEPWFASGARAVVAVPLFDSGAGVLGFLGLERDHRPFATADAQRLMAVARAASLGLQNALAYRDLATAKAVQQRLLDRILSAQEEERRRLSRELHDDLGQSLTSLLIGLRAAQDANGHAEARARIEGLRGEATRALARLRDLARGLRSDTLEDLGLGPALGMYVEEYGRTHGIRADTHVSGLERQRLPQTVELTLYRIAQEALTNTCRHSGARNVSVVVQNAPAEVRLVVEDDGCGFDPRALGDAPYGGLGIHGMRERAELLNGRFWLETHPGGGTAVCVVIPHREAA